MSIHVLCGALALGLFLMSAAQGRACGYVTHENISYHDEAPDTYAAERCRLDLYHPTDREGFATIVWLHAGGLVQGNRYIPGELKEQGYAVAAVDYRLSPKASAPAYIEDAAAAVAWVVNNIEEYRGDPAQVIVAGASAGGYLALMIGLDASWLDAHSINANDLGAIVSMGGQAVTHVAVRAEQGIERTRVVIDELAPLYHVRPDAPPLLLTAGDRDLELLGRYEENAYLLRMLKEAGHTDARLYEMEGSDHAGVERRSHPTFLAFMRDRFTSDHGK